MKNLKLCFMGFAVVLITVFSSCNNDDESSDSSFDDSDLLKVSNVLDRINELDFDSGMETANDESSLSSRTLNQNQTSFASCATVTQTSVGNDFPRTFTVDFGSGCTTNGITRSGMLIFTFSGFLLTAGSEMTIERSNYYVNGYKVEGTVTYENLTTVPGTPQWSRTVVNGQITTPDGLLYTHSGTRTVKQTAGVNTPFILSDNIFEISSGTATVTRPGGSSLTATITTPLIKEQSCSFISEGILHLQGTFLDGDLNYGDGDCDGTAVYTHSDGQTYTVQLN
jgi:hypothetical protein